MKIPDEFTYKVRNYGDFLYTAKRVDENEYAISLNGTKFSFYNTLSVEQYVEAGIWNIQDGYSEVGQAEERMTEPVNVLEKIKSFCSERGNSIRITSEGYELYSSDHNYMETIKKEETLVGVVDALAQLSEALNGDNED